MSYKELLSTFSNSVYNLENKEDFSEELFLSPHSKERINVYRDNLLYGIIQRLSEDFNATKSYLGERNFAFFARKHLIESKIRSANINDFAKGFPGFLESQSYIHEDPLVVALAQVDCLWTFSTSQESPLTLPLGTTHFWQALIDQASDLPSIDLSLTENLYLRLIEGRKELVLIQEEND